MGLFLFFTLFSCAALPKDAAQKLDLPPGKAMIRDVPFHPQLDFQCGPASLAGVLNYHGDPVSPEEIAGEVYRRNLRGALSLDLVLYARKRGFSARFYRGGVPDIVAAVDAGFPLVVMIDVGIGPVSSGHYMVVVGYTREHVVVNSGEDPKKLMAWESFFRGWERADRWTLKVSPGSPARAAGESAEQ